MEIKGILNEEIMNRLKEKGLVTQDEKRKLLNRK